MLSTLPSEDGAVLSPLTSLRSLGPHVMPISDLSWLPALASLEELMLWDIPAADYTPLLALPCLRTLRVPEGRLPVRLLEELRARKVDVEDRRLF